VQRAALGRDTGRPIIHFVHEGTVSGSLWLYGEWERLQTTLLQELLRPGDVAMDVGAHIGTQTVAMALAVQPGGVVHAFEPQQAMVEVLRANAELNGVADIVVAHHAAVGGPLQSASSAPRTLRIPRLNVTHPASPHLDATGEWKASLWDCSVDAGDRAVGNFATFSVAACNASGDASGDPAEVVERGGAAFETVPLLSLDELGLHINASRCPRLIKIDLEGMDALGVEGARELIAACRPFLHVENDAVSVARDLVPLLHKLSYASFWDVTRYVDSQSAFGHFEYSQARIPFLESAFSVNVLAIPSEVPVSALPPRVASVVSRMTRVDPSLFITADYADGVWGRQREPPLLLALPLHDPTGTPAMGFVIEESIRGFVVRFTPDRYFIAEFEV
jgi:hypothetical protein